MSTHAHSHYRAAFDQRAASSFLKAGPSARPAAPIRATGRLILALQRSKPSSPRARTCTSPRRALGAASGARRRVRGRVRILSPSPNPADFGPYQVASWPTPRPTFSPPSRPRTQRQEGGPRRRDASARGGTASNCCWDVHPMYYDSSLSFCAAGRRVWRSLASAFAAERIVRRSRWR